MQWPVRPSALRVVGVVPPVIIPNTNTRDKVQRSITIIVHILPLIRTNLLMLFHARSRVDLYCISKVCGYFRAGCEIPWLAVYPTDLNVPPRSVHALACPEHRCLAASRVFKKPNTVVRLARAINQQVEIAIPIPVYRHRPRPKPHAKVHHQPLMIILDALEISCWKKA